MGASCQRTAAWSVAVTKSRLWRNAFIIFLLFQIQTIPYNRCSVLMLRILKLFGVDPQERGILDHQEWLFFYFWGFKGGFLAAASLWITKQQKVEAGRRVKIPVFTHFICLCSETESNCPSGKIWLCVRFSWRVSWVICCTWTSPSVITLICTSLVEFGDLCVLTVSDERCDWACVRVHAHTHHL